MHKIKQILEEFVNILTPLSINGELFNVERTKPDTVNKYPTIRVVMGSETNQPSDFENDIRSLSVFTDVYLQDKDLVEDDAIQSRHIIESAVSDPSNFNIAIDFVRFIEQGEIIYNDQESKYYSAMLRIEWQVDYEAPSIY